MFVQKLLDVFGPLIRRYQLALAVNVLEHGLTLRFLCLHYFGQFCRPCFGDSGAKLIILIDELGDETALPLGVLKGVLDHFSLNTDMDDAGGLENEAEYYDNNDKDHRREDELPVIW